MPVAAAMDVLVTIDTFLPSLDNNIAWTHHFQSLLQHDCIYLLDTIATEDD